ncbi:MAG: aldehyde ferredoxin oxidoreductase family protein [Mycobacterium leprae]
MIPGYTGNILRVHVGTRKVTITPTPEAWIRDYIGGRGFVARAFWDEIKPGTDPWGPENKLMIAPGPYSGQFISSSGKVHMATLSPATGGYGDSNMGGHMSLELKQAGVDLLIFEGVADHPVTVLIDDGKVEFRDATALWGKNTYETERLLKEQLGDQWQIAVVGPAAENGVVFACIQHDFGRQAGRTGVGTVMANKKIKAFAVRGTKDIPLHDPKAVLAEGQRHMNMVMTQPGFTNWQPYGTPEVVPWANKVGSFPTRNFQSGTLQGFDGLNGPTMKSRLTEIDKGCTSCAMPCGKWGTGELNGKKKPQEGPEYESVALLGGCLGINDIKVVAYLNGLCDELGLDSISAGNVTAWAMECYEKGILTEQQIGHPLRWGNGEDAAWAFEQIAYGHGIGKLLGKGVRAAAQATGKESIRFAMQVKGLEISGYESRYAPAMLLSYMTSDTGGHHSRSWAITHDIATGRENFDGKAEKVIWLQHVRPLFDNLGCCRFPYVEDGIAPEMYADFIRPITGMDMSWDDLLKVSERTWNLTRMIWVRHMPGFGRTFDYPPARWAEEGAPDGPVAGKHFSHAQIDDLLDRYYTLRGWSKDGIPTPEKLHELGLDFCRA